MHGDHSVSSNLVSKFHFVDLAGSERVSRTRNKEERFKGGNLRFMYVWSRNNHIEGYFEYFYKDVFYLHYLQIFEMPVLCIACCIM